MKEQKNANVAAYLPSYADAHPDQVAICLPIQKSKKVEYREISFASLAGSVERAAGLFAAKGVAKGDRVLVLAKPGESLITGAFALLHVGAVPVVIDPGMGMKSFLNCVIRTKPTAVYGVPFGLFLSRLFFRAFASVRSRVSTSALSQLSKSGQTGQNTFPLVSLHDDDPAAILFTSGSTGPAKGVCYNHGMFQAQIDAVRKRFAIEPGEIDFPMLPVFALFNPALGMSTVVPPMNPSRPALADAQLQIRVMRERSVTNSFGSPVLWNKIAETCERTGTSLPDLRRVLAAGASVSPSLVRKLKKCLPNAKIYSPYGATEALPVSAISGEEILECESLTISGKGICVGKPLPGVGMRIVAEEARDASAGTVDPLQEKQSGQIGEIIVRGAMVTRNYDSMPEATAKAKIVDGDGFWHRMGDLGYQDAEGRFWFCGRKAEKVVTPKGKIYYTECCEQVFNQHPKVYRTALLGLGSEAARTPAIVVEPLPGHFPNDNGEIQKLIGELKELGKATGMTKSIEHFFFRKKFPVDVRHNAKIHRLQMAREYYTHGLNKPRQ